MEQALNQFNNQVQSLPLYDTVTGVYEDKMGERFSTKDPFYEKVPKKDPRTVKKGEDIEYNEVRRRPPPNITEQQRKLWKKVMKRAWYHDRNFCGCMPIDIGCGMISIVSIFPIIGSIIAYKMHYKMIKMCHQAGCPAKIEAIMVSNIGVDFMMTLVPLLGVLLSWMKASSTRNAALFDTWLREQSNKHAQLQQVQAQRSAQLQAQAGTAAPSRPPTAARNAPMRHQSRPQQTPSPARTESQSPAQTTRSPAQTMQQSLAQDRPSPAQARLSPTSASSRRTSSTQADQTTRQSGSVAPAHTAARVSAPSSPPQQNRQASLGSARSAPRKPVNSPPQHQAPRRKPVNSVPSAGSAPAAPSYAPPAVPSGQTNQWMPPPAGTPMTQNYKLSPQPSPRVRPPPAGTYYNVQYN